MFLPTDALLLLVLSILPILHGAPGEGYFHSVVRIEEEELIERKPEGCCYNNQLIKTGSSMCEDDQTLIQCVMEDGFPRMIVSDGKKCDKKTTGNSAEKVGCAPKNCLYKGKEVKLGTVIEKQVKDNKYNIVKCLKNGAIDTMSGECEEKSSGKKNALCEDFGPKQ